MSSLRKWLEKLGGRHNRLFILPTRYGFYFLIITFILFLISLSYGHSLAFTTTFIFVALILTSAHYTNFNLAGVEVLTIRTPHDIHADEPIIAQVTLRNISRKNRFDILVSLVKGDCCRGISLHPGEVKTIGISIPPLERGQYFGRRLRLMSTFPFGLFKVWKFWHENFDILVYPAIGVKAPLPAPLYSSQERGDVHNKVELGAEEFYGHFNYQEGMPLRSIDWRAYARGRGILLKKFIEKADGQYLFSLDHMVGEREQALSDLASLVEVAEVRSVSYALVLEREKPQFGHGFAFKRECLRKMALYQTQRIEVHV